MQVWYNHYKIDNGGGKRIKISTVILDWAGTAVDFGCFAPVAAFQSAFESAGLSPTMEETRAPMGMQKRAHIRTMLSGERLGGYFRKQNGRDFEAADVDAICQTFEPALFSVLKDNCAVMPGVLETIKSCVKRPSELAPPLEPWLLAARQFAGDAGDSDG